MATPEQPRTVIALTGADRVTFLQNLVTNDIVKSKLTYNALLTPQGKYLADFFVVMRDDDILVDVATSLAPALAQRLGMYRLRADVQITESDQSVSCGIDAKPDGAFNDPRHPALGWRFYGDAIHGTVDWQALRVAHIIPETGIEIGPDSYILEQDFERLNGVDFKKGCYVGQEVTARMKHKTELRKGLVQVQLSGDVPQNSPITTDGKEIGHILTQSEDLALAYIRFDRAKGDIQCAGSPITIL